MQQLSLLLDVYVYFSLISNKAHISHRLVMWYVSAATMVVATEPSAAHSEPRRWTIEDCFLSDDRRDVHQWHSVHIGKAANALQTQAILENEVVGLLILIISCSLVVSDVT